MAVDRQHQSSTYGYSIELEYAALKRCLVPMPDDNKGRVVAKLVAIMLVGTWLTITIAVAFERAVVPPHWLGFTALIFLLVGRLWDLEVRQLLPVGTSEQQPTETNATPNGTEDSHDRQ